MLLFYCPREVLAFEYLKHVSQHFDSSPDLGAALVLHVELLLQKGKELLGKQKIEDIITGASYSNENTVFWKMSLCI